MDTSKIRNKNLNKSGWIRLKSKFSMENFKKVIIGSSTSRKMFRLYFLVLIIGAILLYLPISLRPFEQEGFGGEIFNLRYVDNGYILNLTDSYTGVLTEHRFDFLDCLFMAFSGFTDTGLSLFSINSVFSIFGQIILMILIQIGGFGIMFFIFLIWKIFKRSDKVSINQALLAQSEKGNTKIGNTGRMLITSCVVIVLIELFFTIFYWLWFMYVPAYEQITIPSEIIKSGNITVDSDKYLYVYQNAGASFFAALFHSVSVINNAGFDILGGDSIASYRNGINSIFLLITAIQFIIGGIGFPIIYDFLSKYNFAFKVNRYKKIPFIWFSCSKNIQHRVSLFTKLSTYTFLIVGILGIMFSFLFECTILGGGDNPLWNDKSAMFGTGSETLTYYNKSVNIIFQSLSTRSAGYSTFNNDIMNPITKWLNIALMFIGGSASSTAGGIRTSTLAIIFLTIKSRLKGSYSVNVFKRSLKNEDIVNSFIVLTVAIVIIAIGGVVLMTSLKNTSESIIDNAFTNSIFMCTSAFGTTGLTITNVDNLTWVAKVYLMFLMFIGQLGVSSTILAFKRNRVKDNLFKNLSEDVRIG